MAASERWYFTREQINSNPNRRMGIDADKELSYRQLAANFIQDMGQRLQVTQLCINTAIVYMHRFYMFHTFQRFPKNAISTCALFLAAKVEEQPRKLEHVIRCAQVCLKEKDVSQDTKSEAYNNLAHEVVTNENIMLQTLGFDIAIEHPHTYVVKCCQLVGASKDLAQTSYFMATNSLHLTTMCLQYKPTVVACVCIYLASKWSNWKIQQSKEGREWFYYIDKSVTMKELEEITSEFLTILEKSPSRLKRKLHTGSKSSINHHDSSGDKRFRPEPSSSSAGLPESFSVGPGPPNEAKKPGPPSMAASYREKQSSSSSSLPPAGNKPAADHYHHHSVYSRHGKPHPPAIPSEVKREVKPPSSSHNHPLKHKYPPLSNKEEYARKHVKQDSNGHNSEAKRPHIPNDRQQAAAYYDMAKHHHSSQAPNHFVNNTKPPKFPPPPKPPTSAEDIKPHNLPPQQRYLPENHVKIKVEAEPAPLPEPAHFPPVHHPSPPPPVKVKEEYNSIPPAFPSLLKEDHNAFSVISPLKDFPPQPPVPEEVHSLSNNVLLLPPAPKSPLLELARNTADHHTPQVEGGGRKHKHKYPAPSSAPSIKMVLPIPKEKTKPDESSPKEGAIKLKISKNKITPPPEQSNSVTSTEPLKIVIHRNQIKPLPTPSSGKSKSRKRDRSPSDYHHSSKRPEGEKVAKHSKADKNSELRKGYHHSRSGQYSELHRHSVPPPLPPPSPSLE